MSRGFMKSKPARVVADYPRIQMMQTTEMKKIGRPHVTDGEALGAAAKRDLMRYYAMVERNLLTLRDRWTVKELCTACELLAQHGWPPGGEYLLVNQDHALTIDQGVALLDALERAALKRPLGRESFESVGLLTPVPILPARNHAQTSGPR